MVKDNSIPKVLVIFLAITLVSSSFTAFSAPVFALGIVSLPAVFINTPSLTDTYIFPVSINFNGNATDIEDGLLTASLKWFSDIDGLIGTGGSFTKVLSVGNHMITVEVADSSGNIGTVSIPVNVIGDTPPTISILAADGSSFVEGTLITLSGTATDHEDGDLSADITWESDIYGTFGNGSTVSSSTAPVGTHIITAYVTDSFGNKASSSVSMTITSVVAVDNPPSINIVDPANGSSYVFGTLVDFFGTSVDFEDGPIHSTISWSSDIDGFLGIGGSPFQDVALSVGDHTITASVTDSFGNTVSEIVLVTITVDSPPTLDFMTPDDNDSSLEGMPIPFAGLANDPEDGSISNLIKWTSNNDGLIGIGSGIINSSLSVGSHIITASVTDSFGNTVSTSHSIIITEETEEETVTLTVEAIDSNGDIRSMWTEIYHDDLLIETGFTSFSFSAELDEEYVIDVANFEDYIFEHWEDGTASNKIHVIANNDVTLTALYQVGTDLSPPEDKVLVCHDDITLEIGAPVLGVHLAHGDTEGECKEESYREIEIFAEAKDGNTHVQITKGDVESDFDFGFTNVGQIFTEIQDIIDIDTRNIDVEWIFKAKNDDDTLEFVIEGEHGVANVKILQDGVKTEFEVASAKRDMIKNEIELVTGINLHDIDFDWTLEMKIELNSNKYYVCHFPPGNPLNSKDLLISESSLSAHFAHGDKKGKCSDVTDKDELKKKATTALIKKQQKEMKNKNELKEKREAFKEIKNELKDLSKVVKAEEKQRIKTLVDEIKEIIKTLNEDPEYDKEHKKIIKAGLKEIKTEIINEIKSDGLISKHKIDSKITKLSKSDNPKYTAKKMGLNYEKGKIQIAIQLSGKDPAVIEQLSSIGKIDAKDDNHVQLTVKLSDLPKLRTIGGIDNIRSPFPAVQFEEALSEGVYFINADLAQFTGITGQGIKAAVLDLAFTDNPKISDNVVQVKSFRQGIGYVPIQGNENEALHGTAVAEIISDVAPDVQLYLYSMETDIEFAAAVDEAISEQVDIIVMSAGWPNFPTDGSSHITKKIEQAVDNGITFVVPAGNFANKHWEGTFADSNFNNWHEFSNSDEGLTIEVTEERVAEEKPIVAHLMWDVGMGDVADFELVLVNPLGQIVDYSANEQTTKSDTPFEYIHHIPDIDGIYSIGILFAGDMSSISERPSASLEIFSVNDDLEYPISKSSVSVPADATGAIVVGAVNHLDGTLESFSSQGPTNNGKLAPHVVGPDGVTTIALDGNPFYGTSATAPYVAGLAALIIQTNPDITPQQLLNEIQQNTDSSLFSLQNEFDYAYGYGSASAIFLIEAQEVLE